MFKSIFFCAAITMFVASAHAWDSKGDSGLPGEYLYAFSGGARGLGLGLAQTALSGNSNLIYSNPASVADLWWQEASFGYTPLFSNGIFVNAAYGFPMKKNTVFGLMIASLSSGEAEKTNDLGESLGAFEDRQIALTICYAKKLHPKLHMGLNAKFLTHTIDTYSEKGAGADVGIIYRIAAHHYWALNVVNVIPPRLGPDAFPVVIKAGFWHSLMHKKLALTTDVLLKDMFKSSNAIAGWFYGLEYTYSPLMQLRLGFNDKQASAGFGVSTRLFDFDYAFVYHPLGFLHSLSLNARFGFMPSEAEVRIKSEMDTLQTEKKVYLETIEEEDQRMNNERKKLKLQAKLTMKFSAAFALYQKGEYELAREKIEEILKEDRSFEEANMLLRDINERLNKRTVEIKYKEAKQLYENSHYTKAMQVIEYILSLDDGHLNTIVLRHLTRAQLLLVDRKYDEAKNELVEILKIEPTHEEANNLLKRIQTIIDVNK